MSKQVRHKAQQRKNKNQAWIWSVIALLVLGASVLWFINQNTAGSQSYPKEISVGQASAKRDAGAFVLDVRQPDEWTIVHIPGATLIPLDQLASRANELPHDQEIVVVCHSGNRSAQGRDILRGVGFTQVTSMAGGMVQWEAAGLPTVSGP